MAVLVAAGITVGIEAWGQTVVVPAHPGKFVTRGVGSGEKGGIQAGTSIQGKRPEPEKKVVRVTVVGPRRTWTNSDGKKIEASLASFSPSGKAEAGPIEVIREGKIRLLLDDQSLPVEYPLAKLSLDDQFYAKSAAQAVKSGAVSSEKKQP